jgi:signal peptide peptidase SppA
MMQKATRLSQALNEHLWCISPSAFASMREVLEGIESGAAPVALQRSEQAVPYLVEGIGDTRRTPYATASRRGTHEQARSVLIVEVSGTIFPKGPSELLRVFGGVSLSEIVGVIRRGVADPNVGSIIAVFDSPGGMVAGVPEAAAEIRSLRGTKPMSAIANFQAASAAYYLAAQFDEVVASPSSSLGSIGVVAQYASEGAALEKAGIAVQTLKYPDKKAEADGISPLSQEAVAFRMAQIKRVYAQFVSDLVRGRRRPHSQVENDFGRGRSLDAKAAVKVGMADRMATLESVIAEHVNGKARRSPAFRSHVAAMNERAVELPRGARTAAWLRERWNLAAN